MDDVQWRTYPHNDNYEVSDMGRVRRAKDLGVGGRFKCGGLLKASIDRYGYSFVRLYWDGKFKNITVHKLVLETFIGDCPKGMECNHRDGKKANNCVTNLEWDTHLENIKHAKENSLIGRGEKHSQAKLTINNVIKIRKLYQNGWKQGELARKFDVSQPHVSCVVNGKKWTHTVQGGQHERHNRNGQYH